MEKNSAVAPIAQQVLTIVMRIDRTEVKEKE